jgi:hypothetical protein
MKKFVILFYGYEEPTPQVMEGYNAWFTSMGARLIDSGNPFAGGREVSKAGTRALTLDEAAPLTGYTIISAENIDEAEKLLAGLPIIHSVRIYEAMSM